MQKPTTSSGMCKGAAALLLTLGLIGVSGAAETDNQANAPVAESANHGAAAPTASTGDAAMTNVRQPGDLIPALAAAYQTGRVENMLNLYEPDAVLLDKDGAELRGHAGIAREFAGLIALRGTMKSINRYTLVGGDIALLSAEWRIDYKDANGAPQLVSGRSAEVARRQADGRWLYVVDHPLGAK